MDEIEEKDEGEGELPALLERASHGDQGAWRALIARYGRRVYALARSRRLSHDTAEEIAQSVFATVAAKLIPTNDPSAPATPDSSADTMKLNSTLFSGGYTERGRFESWLFRIAMNRVRDEIRRRNRHALPTDPYRFAQVIDTGDDGASKADPGELEQLRTAIDGLSEPDREVIELRHHAGLDFKRIAEILGEPVGTVLARHHRALRKIKALIGSEGPRSGREDKP